MSKKQNINEAETARIAGHLAHLGLNINEHFKGTLSVPKGKTYSLAPGVSDDGYHATLKPESIQKAKQQIGIPDSLYTTRQLLYREMPDIRMVSPEKNKQDLTRKEKCSLEDAAYHYLYGDSNRLAHMEDAINTLLINELETNIHVYVKLDLKGKLELTGGGKPVILIVHEANFYPGGEIVMMDRSPLTMNATKINYINGGASEANTNYDVSIKLATNHPGQNGQKGQDQEAAGDGDNGADHTGKDENGDPGGPGQNGQPGGVGIGGAPGPSSPDGIFFVETLNCGVFVQAVGSDGGKGGDGGNGGDGGKGGKGGKGGDGGSTGAGGKGGNGGDGGKGGDGLNGGDGGAVTLYAENLTTKIFDAEINGGTGGIGGVGGEPGLAGKGGSGNPDGGDGKTGTAGDSGSTGASGTPGTVSIQKALPPVIDSFSPNQGPAAGGTKLTINGKNFFNNDKGVCIIEFTINGKPLTNITLLSTSMATGTTPANPAGEYPVVAFNTETKAAATGPGYFTYK
jgi:hypothetical protein